MKFLYSDADLFKSAKLSCMEYYSHAWAVTHNCSLDMINMLQKQVCRAAGSTTAASFELLPTCQNIVNVSLS